MSGTDRKPLGTTLNCSLTVGPGGGSGTGIPFVPLSVEQKLVNVEGRLRVLEQSLQGQRLRADTAEAELAKANEKIDKAWNRSHALDHEGFIPGALDAWKRPVRQHLPYDFSGNPGTSATQYCNGWNDCGGYWSAHASDLQQRLTSAGQRIAELTELLERMLEDDDMPVHWFAQRIDAALNPNPEACQHETPN